MPCASWLHLPLHMGPLYAPCTVTTLLHTGEADSPIDALQQLTQAIVDAQENILANTGPGDGPLRVNRNVHARFGYMPHGVAEHNRTNISGIRSSDVGLFLQVTGTVIRTGTVSAGRGQGAPIPLR